MAGGFTYDGYYLDAHSGISNDEVFNLFEKIVKMLPNLKAITFEMLPENLNFVSEKEIKRQLEKMKLVWDKRGKNVKIKQSPITPIKNHGNTREFAPIVKEWEITLGSLAIEKYNETSQSELAKILMNDNGIPIIQGLVKKFRSSLIVSSLKLTCRYIMLKYGLEYINDLFKDFWQVSKPMLFATDNGIEFGMFIVNSLDSTDIVLEGFGKVRSKRIENIIRQK